MDKHFFQKHLPDPVFLKNHPSLQFLGNILHEPRLWILNRRSLAGAAAVGMFFCFIPFPSQMLLAAIAAVFLRVNLPLSVALVWLSNPVTMLPILYVAYMIGNFMLGREPSYGEFGFTLEWFFNAFDQIWLPALIGNLVLAVVCGGISYFAVHWIWRVRIIRAWQRRRAKRLATSQIQ